MSRQGHHNVPLDLCQECYERLLRGLVTSYREKNDGLTPYSCKGGAFRVHVHKVASVDCQATAPVTVCIYSTPVQGSPPLPHQPIRVLAIHAGFSRLDLANTSLARTSGWLATHPGEHQPACRHASACFGRPRRLRRRALRKVANAMLANIEFVRFM